MAPVLHKPRINPSPALATSPLHLTCSLPKDCETPQLYALLLIEEEEQIHIIWRLFIFKILSEKLMVL